MNKCRIHRPFLHRVRDLIGDKNPEDTKLNRRALLFIKKWDLTKRGSQVYHNGKQVVPIEDTEEILKREAVSGGMPLSRDGAYNYLSRSYVGFKKNKILAWLKRVESLQLNKRRTEVPRSKPARPREGATNWRMASFNEGRFNLGVDLFDIPAEWGNFKHFFVAVLQKTGYTWAIPLKSKLAHATLTALRSVFSECKTLFGSAPTGVTSDKGGEFQNKKWAAWLKSKGVKQKFEKKLCSWVEKKNSTFGRAFAVMLDIHRPKGRSTGGFYKALELALTKINNIVSRKTRKAPADWTPEDFTKRTKRYNRKIKARPKRREHAPFPLGARVRQMQKQAIDKGGFYKSYEGTRSHFHRMWSKKIFRVTKRKLISRGFGYKYKIDNPSDSDWLPQRELQLIPDASVIRLAPQKAAPKQKPPGSSKPSRRGFPPKKASKTGLRRGFPPKAKGVSDQAGPTLRRSTRAKRKPVRYGFFPDLGDAFT